MPDNFLSQLTPDWFSHVMGSIGGDAADPSAQPADPSAVAPQQAPGAPVNLLQGLGYAPDSGDAPDAQAPQAAPRRNSLLSTIGQISDVLARVGGAAPLYQPTLDARDDRATALADHARAVDMANLQKTLTQQEVTKGQNSIGDIANGKVALMLRGLTAVQNGGGDVSKAAPVLAQQLGLDPDRAQQIVSQISSDPHALAALNATFNAQKEGAEYSMTPTYVKDAQGNVHIVQLGKDGTTHELAGYVPADQVKEIDQGGQVGLVDPRTGKVIRQFSKSGALSPDTVPIVDAKGNVVGAKVLPGSKTQQTLDKPEKGNAKEGDPYTIYSGARSQIQAMDRALADLRADPALKSATGYIAGAIDTPARQAINAKIQAIKGMAVPVATALLRAQGVSRPAQTEVMSTANGIISDLGLLRQSTGGYVGSIDRARAGLRERIQQLDSNAQRTGILGQGGGGGGSTRPILTTKPAGAKAPTVSNW
jgi:hypothetical protein